MANQRNDRLLLVEYATLPAQKLKLATGLLVVVDAKYLNRDLSLSLSLFLPLKASQPIVVPSYFATSPTLLELHLPFDI